MLDPLHFEALKGLIQVLFANCTPPPQVLVHSENGSQEDHLEDSRTVAMFGFLTISCASCGAISVRSTRLYSFSDSWTVFLELGVDAIFVRFFEFFCELFMNADTLTEEFFA